MLRLRLPCCCAQECFSAGYASFNLEALQYSTSAAPGAYAEMANKYDPKLGGGPDKYGSEGGLHTTKVRRPRAGVVAAGASTAACARGGSMRAGV